MRKPLHIWLIFLSCFGLLLGAMAWVGWHTLVLERDRETAALEADQQERVRLALWRLDFQASSLMMRENARPPHDFRPFHAPEGLVNKSYDNVLKGDVLVPSPLLAEVPEHVLLHFQMDSRGQVISPQVPQNNERALALSQFINTDALQRSEQRLGGLRILLAKPAVNLVPQTDVSSRGDKTSLGEPLLNRQFLAEAACAVRFNFDDSDQELARGNDASQPRNSAWAPQQEQVASQQMLYNMVENASRNRAITLQNAEAMKQQSTVKLKEAPSKVASKAMSSASDDLAAAKPVERKEKADATFQDKARRPVVPAPATPPSTVAETPVVASAMAAAPAAALPAAAPIPAAPQAEVAREGGGAALHKGKSPTTASTSRPFQGVWIGKNENLMLTREAFVDGVRTVQGVWLDWPALHAAWLREVADLFPDAQLVPAVNAIPGARPSDDPLRLATLPLRLVPGIIALPPLPFWTPLRKSLGIALACVLLAGAAVGLVLYGTVALSERRAAFVSAVTHELRTPLTTFRLYSEMLADGMVKDEAQRKTYLDTLTGEASRLSHLVENVLSYARLERGSAKARAETLTIGALLDRILPRLQQRASDCAMEVRVHATDADRKAELHIDAAAVEQILFNLVDNACKYAAPRAAEPVIHLEADTAGKFAMLRVRDHGGGISRGERHRIFHPFHKSADQAAHSAPGVGLGLALCRRLATALGGAITLDSAHKGGACFVLRLPK